jgi:DNA-binding SARP family transcriptional activator
VTDSAAPPLVLRLLGPFEARVNGTPLPRLRSRKGHWLLALLVLRHGREVERSWLVAMLWPDSPESAALANLRSSLKDLRQALGDEAFRLRSPTPHTLTLDLSGAEVDLLAFDATIARGRERSDDGVEALEEAIALYRGPFLEGCSDSWAFEERQVRAEAYLGALEALAARALQHRDLPAAERYLRRAVAADSLRESAYRALMQTLAAGGNYAAALLVYRELRLLLHRELNAEPDPETRALFEQLRPKERRCSEEVARRPALRAGSALSPVPPAASPALLEDTLAHHLIFPPESGPLPVDSPFYVQRAADIPFRAAIARHDSIVLVKGARQMGKTSLLARGLQQARKDGNRVVVTDLLRLNAAHLASPETLYVTLAGWIADQLELDVFLDQVWSPRLGPSGNFDRYLRREVLGSSAVPLVWGLDEVDVLSACPFGSEVFALFRSLHGARSLDPDGPWHRLTLAMAYAIEPHFFIREVHLSPFNVGTRVTLEDFSVEEVSELNRRYDRPLRNDAEVERYARRLGGQPYLVHRGLQEMVKGGMDLAAFEAQADRDDGVFGDHLKRLLVLLIRAPELREEVEEVLRGRSCQSADHFFRLRSAGMLAGPSARGARLRCPLYGSYLERHLL